MVEVVFAGADGDGVEIGNVFVPLWKSLKDKTLTVVSTKEFSANQEKYLDMAVKGQVYVQRGIICLLSKVLYKITSRTKFLSRTMIFTIQ